MRKIKLLMIDDDIRICRLVKRYVEKNDFDLVFAFNAEEAHSLLDENSISLILLDVMLPGIDGFTLAKEFRQSLSVPIIFLTAKTDTDDKVFGLEMGADDYITKPFEERELIARIRTVLRRSKNNGGPQTHSKQIRFGNWSLDLIKQSLKSPEGKEVEITSTEFTLLVRLLKQSNHMINREDILNILSGRDWSPLNRSADMAISKLRKKIEKDPRKPRIIKTVRNKGYQLTAAVHYV